MYCKHCGREIADDSKFCQHCGGKQLVEGQHWVFIKSHGLSSAYILLDSFQLHPECGVVTCGYL